MPTERQAKILHTIVDEYIHTANPVSSAVVFDLNDFGVSCPTIRNEMAELTEIGYLAQPHTSAGRVPTEQGYRFFVDSFIGQKPRKAGKPRKMADGADWKKLARFLSDCVDDAILYVDARSSIRYVGLKKVFSLPEFQTHEAVISLFEEFENLENSIDKIFDALDRKINVFIGSENPFFESKEFSMITFPSLNGFIALVGPMRMDYRRNISLFFNLYE